MKTKILTGLVLGLGLGLAAQAATSMPKVAKPYQSSFKAAWKQVEAGELPVYECTHVATMAARDMDNPKMAADAKKAFKACYVDSFLRYSEAYFGLRNNAEMDTQSGKPYGCRLYKQYAEGHVTSLQSYLHRIGYSAAELNAEIDSKLVKVAAQCQVSLD